jgi:hypothetical protein
MMQPNAGWSALLNDRQPAEDDSGELFSLPFLTVEEFRAGEKNIEDVYDSLANAIHVAGCKKASILLVRSVLPLPSISLKRNLYAQSLRTVRSTLMRWKRNARR